MFTKAQLEKASLLAGLQLYGLPIGDYRATREHAIKCNNGFLAKCKEFGINPRDYEKNSIVYKNIQKHGYPADSGLMWGHENTVIITTVAEMIAEVTEGTCGKHVSFTESLGGGAEYIFNPETGKGEHLPYSDEPVPENYWVNGVLYMYSAVNWEIYVISK